MVRGKWLVLSLVFAMSVTSGCRHMVVAGSEDVPAGVETKKGDYRDIAPRWSHSGKQIAFLRETPDRKLQLFIGSADLSVVVSQLEPQVVCPDLPLQTARVGTTSSERLEWSPNDRYILYPHVEWFQQPSGERLPGRAIWYFDTKSGASGPMAIHPKKYMGPFYIYRSPKWSPDGKYIAFVGEGRDGQTAIFVRPLDGTHVEVEKPRYDENDEACSPTWSKDGRLAFRQGVLRAITATPVEMLKTISPGKLNSGTLWRSDKQSLLVSDSVTPPRIIEAEWSDDCKMLLATMSTTPSVRSSYFIAKFSTSVDTKPEILTKPDSNGSYAVHWIDLSHYGYIHETKLGAQIVIRSLNGIVQNRLPIDRVEDLDWSPKGDRLVVSPSNRVRKGRATTLRILEVGG